jgi:Fe-S cluster assembly protein SufD
MVDSRVTTDTTGFYEEAVNEIAWAKDEPDWLRRRRAEAWTAWQSLPMPSRKDEEWRRTDISGLDLDAVIPFLNESERVDRQEDLHEALAASVEDKGERGGLLAHSNSAPSFGELSAELAAKGVIFTDMDTAVREHSELLKQHLNSAVSLTESKFAALHGAFWSGGAFLYVPRNVQVDLPLHFVTWANRQGVAVMPHILAVAETGAAVTLVNESVSAEDGAPGLVNGVAELVLGAGAQLRYVSLQRWGSTVSAFSHTRALVHRDAALSSLTVVLGSRFTKAWLDASLQEPGATARMGGVMFAGAKQRFHHHTVQDHRSPDTTSDLLYKVVLAGAARSEYSGLIKVHEGAQRTDAYQANRNLSLSSEARADAIPKLEIEANDVRCTHGATVGPIDEEQLFYLMARGLDRRSAQRMIVRGFFEPALERIPLEDLRDTVRRAIESKLSAVAV